MKQVATPEIDPNLLYRHTLRPEWGLAAFHHRAEDKRAFQFEDGRIRVFRSDFLHHLQAVDAPTDRSARTLERLGAAGNERTKAAKPQSGPQSLPIAAQILLFSKLYPEGFVGAKWRKAKRGFNAKRRLKRHRNASVTEAQSTLSYSALAGALASGQAKEVADRLCEMLRASDLVTAKESKSLNVKADDAEQLITALHGLLYGENLPFAIRFERWVTALARPLKKTPSWSLATAPLTITRPSEHICVRASIFGRQAQWMAPRLVKERQVSGRLYERWLSMAKAVGEELKEAGLTPRDLLDVYDFMSETMTPKKVKEARELYENQLVVPEVAESQSA